MWKFFRDVVMIVLTIAMIPVILASTLWIFVGMYIFIGHLVDLPTISLHIVLL